MSTNRQIPTLSDLAFNALAKQSLFRTTLQLGNSSVIIDIAKEHLLPRLLHAVINDDRKTVREMLDQNPELILLSPEKNCIIENQCTWQKFYVEDALTTAVKLNQVKMTTLLLYYYKRLEQNDHVINARKSALSAWKSYKIVNDEIIIPKQYAELAQLLIDVFKDETFPNGIPGIDNVPSNIELSDATECALSCLLLFLVPINAVTLDKHVDVELFLLAIYKAYAQNYVSLDLGWDKLDAITTRVIGLTQSSLIQETGEIFCEGLEAMVNARIKGQEKEISALAAAHKMEHNLRLDREPNFYRGISRDARSGCGFDFYCGIYGRLGGLMRGTTTQTLWESFIKQKQQAFRILCESHNSPINTNKAAHTI